jgi:hypothetical protein
MDRDQTLSYNQHKEEMLQEDLDKFMEQAIGREPKGDSWI